MSVLSILFYTSQNSGTLCYLCKVLLIIFITFHLSSAAATKKPLPYEKWCERDCGDYPERAICATNNRTFNNRCQMYHYSCLTKNSVEIAYKGTCKDLTECQVLQMVRKQQLKMNKKKTASSSSSSSSSSNHPSFPADSSPTDNVHIPKCYKKSGRFFAKQCLNKYCWCVKPETGKFVVGTSQEEKSFSHNCQDYSDDSASIEDDEREEELDASLPECRGDEKKRFARSIYDLILRTESYKPSTLNGSASVRVGPVRTLFMELDVDADGVLKKKELHEYRRYAKLMVPEKVCARTMQIHCDLNDNKQIELSEWLMCVDPKEMTDTFRNLDADDNNNNNKDFGYPSSREDNNPTQHNLDYKLFPPQNSNDDNAMYDPGYVTINPDEDCFERKESQIRMQLFPLPECQPNGSFKPVQCSRVLDTRICWCVDEKTGLAIKNRVSGRIVRGKNPAALNCNTLSRRFSSTSEECVGDVKANFDKQFLRALNNHLKDIQAELNQPVNFPTINQTFWNKSFEMFDNNVTDSFLEKQETKWIVSVAETTLNLGKVCADTLIERCDLNGDNKLSQYEWNACFNNGDPILPIA
ncbi:uncharacterized protein LOC142339083 [Convolutriloba macropyga]|uniref:uncharacterized protein LOC142339083 n=1 Tax=Convolutriloba macropyga TaxID=536237 RepID=UPI003F520264